MVFLPLFLIHTHSSLPASFLSPPPASFPFPSDRNTYQDEPFNLHPPPALSFAHFLQSNLISQRDVDMLVETGTLKSLGILHILLGGPSLAMKSGRWVHKWKNG